MHRLIDRTLQMFIADTYGFARWSAVADKAGLSPADDDALMRFDVELTDRVMEAVASELGRPIEAVLEDVGTYLVSHPNAQPIRRLLRFCGTDFEDFLLSLEELPDRARLVLTDLRLPEIEVTEDGDGRYAIRCGSEVPWFSNLLAGLVRAMSDDYGALALLEHSGEDGLRVTLVQSDYAKARDFALAAARRPIS